MQAPAVSMQGEHYDAVPDYTHGSPHLSDTALRQRLQGVLLDALAGLSRRGLPLQVLEIGAGHGGYTEPALAAGAQVTAVDMSGASLDRLRERYGSNPNLTTVHSPEGALTPVDAGDFTLLLAVSVLHHIPDYVEFVRDALPYLRPGASVLTLQDPLWYPRLPRVVHVLDRAAYATWRLAQPGRRRGLGTALRSVRGRLREDLPTDMVEYHVHRQGVDEQALTHALRPRFERVEVLRYWSSQLPAAKRVAARWSVANTFGLRAEGLRAG